ncbi:Per1-like protein [Abortiporus biennis]|nr:Per1-like protein [Abortiporus biennis]
MRVPLASFVTLLTLSLSVLSSSGDRAEKYISCVELCKFNNCANWQGSLALRLTRWTCADDCKYGCMHLITDEAVKNGERIQQYHGKWPFWRLFGMQEPASVAFSLLNLYFHARGIREVKRRLPNDHPMRSYYIGFGLVSINAWVWSSVFHTRDLPATEKLDYFSAAAAILYALYYTVIRIFHLYPLDRVRLVTTHSSNSDPSGVRTLWKFACLILFLGHVSYLTLLPRFDYTYNMAFNLIIGMTHNLLWLLYSLPSSVPIVHRFPSRARTYRPSYACKAAVFVALTTAATALELFDFPPWAGVIDAHALWHLSTAPIAAFWYDFIIEDALDEGWRGQKM